jgi:hypothetical protein
MKKTIITIFIAGIVGVSLGALLGYGPMLRYKSEGVLSMEMGTSEYKRFTELANDVTSISQFLSVSPPPNLKREGFEALVKDVAKGEWHKPLPKLSKLDAKELPDAVLQMEQERERERKRDRDKNRDGDRENEQDKGEKRKAESSVYLGLRLTYIARDPLQATELTAWLGSYFKEVATREAMREQIARWGADNRQFSDRAQELKLKYEFDIEQAKSRATALKKIVSQYPESTAHELRQVVDVRKDNEKFMSPIAQLVGAESEMIAIREKIQKLNREIEQQAFAGALLGSALEAMRQVHNGSEGVGKLAVVIAEFSKKAKTDAEREKLLSLAADVSQITARFLSQAQFIAPPSIPSRSEGLPPLASTVLMGLLFALMAAAYCWRDVIHKLYKQDEGTTSSLTT